MAATGPPAPTQQRASRGDVPERWYVVDAKDQVLGRLATRVATRAARQAPRRSSRRTPTPATS